MATVTASPTETLEEEFGERMRGYQADPVGFCEDILGVHLWSKQREIAEAVATEGKVAVKSANTTGKTFLASDLLLWWLYTHCPSRVVTTATTWQQVKNLLWAEVNTRYQNATLQVGECLKTEINIDADWYGVGLSTNDPQSFQGHHSPNIMVIVDEANGVSEPIFGAIDAIISGGNSRILLIGNPIAPVGRFYDVFTRPEMGYKLFTIAAEDTPVFTGEEVPPVVLDNLMGADWPEEVARDYGEASPFYLARVLAEFPTGQEDAVLVPTAWVEAAKRRARPAERIVKEDLGPFIQVGLDVARGGANRSVLAWRSGRTLYDIAEVATNDTGQLRQHAQAKAAELHKEHKLPVVVAVDEIGVGAGVVDNWEYQEGVECVGVNVGGASAREDCVVLRDEVHWRVRELLREDNEQEDMIWAVPERHRAESDRAQNQLGSIRWDWDGRGRIKIEPKADMLRRNMPSPDEADVVTLAFAEVRRVRKLTVTSQQRPAGKRRDRSPLNM